ncbi:MAG: hypothetical protein Q7U04_05585 [Bacteriovorax sp.]|nr:hypothetical protein [Bacteriovorax sp.]
MKKIFLIMMFILSFPLVAQTNFTAVLVKNGTYLSIHMMDDHLIPPFEAGELWKILRANDQRKTIQEKELVLTCEALTNQTMDVFGACSLLLPYNLFQKIGNKMIFKAEGKIAANLNRYFVDSAYLSMQNNEVFLSSINTQRQFVFGINENLIQK